MKQLKITHYCVLQPGSEVKKPNVRYSQFCPLKPGFIQFKPGLTYWAGQNQFNPGKMPTLVDSVILLSQMTHHLTILMLQ